MSSNKMQICLIINTLGSAYNKFRYNEHPATMSRFLYIKLIACNVKKFIYKNIH